jgi:glycerol uptake facilitator-like aquaporin
MVANFNPAVSLALGITRKMSKRRVAMYIFAQLLASIVSIYILGFSSTMIFEELT